MNGPDKGCMKQPRFRPKDESPEEVERARLAAGEDQLGELRRARAPSGRSGSAEHQSGIKHIVWHKTRQAWHLRDTIRNGPDKGGVMQPQFRPKDQSPEEVERARLVAVEALRRLEGEDQLGELRRAPSGRSGSAEHQSGIKHIVWHKTRQDQSPEEVERALRRLEGEDQLGELRRERERQSGVKYISWFKQGQAWRVQYRIENGPDKGSVTSLRFRPKDGSQQEVERARPAAVEALRRLEEEDQLGELRREPERQSGVKYISWFKQGQAWRVQYRIENGPDKGSVTSLRFRPKDGSQQE
ncbi:unnamed protein product, partial [Prorocentrum cordatum]